ncbi:MAG: methyltransferase family protein, partial [Parvularculaceae bacterium]
AVLRWVATTIFVSCFAIIAIAQIQMGASWRIGVPAEDPGALVAHGTFRWSRHPIFVKTSPHIGSAAVLEPSCRQRN